MATSLSCFDKNTSRTKTYYRVDKHLRIGVVRPDYHGLLYACVLGNYDRYEALQAACQLYILESNTNPVIPLRYTSITGVCREVIRHNDNWTEEDYAAACRHIENARWSPEAFARTFRCPIYDTPEEMADPEKFDGILIGNCSWMAEDHVELAMPFIKAGIPLFIDKPFANNAKDAALLLKAAREYNCPVFSSSILFDDDAHRRMEDKKLGRTHLVVSSFDRTLHLRKAGVHLLSNFLGAVRYANGLDYRIKSVTYMGTGKIRSSGKPREADADHNEVWHVELEDGTLGILNAEGFGHYAFHVQAYCEHGISSEYTTEPTMRGGIIHIAQDFAEMIKTRVPVLEYDRIFEFVAAIDAGIRSRDEGRPVTLQEIADEVGWVYGYSDRKAAEKD